jgi:hypothetical protein
VTLQPQREQLRVRGPVVQRGHRVDHLDVRPGCSDPSPSDDLGASPGRLLRWSTALLHPLLDLGHRPPVLLPGEVGMTLALP